MCRSPWLNADPDEARHCCTDPSDRRRTSPSDECGWYGFVTVIDPPGPLITASDLDGRVKLHEKRQVVPPGKRSVASVDRSIPVSDHSAEAMARSGSAPVRRRANRMQ